MALSLGVVFSDGPKQVILFIKISKMQKAKLARFFFFFWKPKNEAENKHLIKRDFTCFICVFSFFFLKKKPKKPTTTCFAFHLFITKCEAKK